MQNTVNRQNKYRNIFLQQIVALFVLSALPEPLAWRWRERERETEIY